MSQLTATDAEIMIARVINAPRERVFAAWTDQAQLLKWFAPQGCSIEYKKLEARLGGTFLSVIRVPNFKDCWCKGRYLEFNAPHCIVYLIQNCDEQGNDVTAEEAGMDPEWPVETVVTVTFEDLGGKTRLTLHQTASEAVAKRTGAYQSWHSQLDNLEVLLA
jgi:uncharacterized protein YndB with AHSA1/START domain